MKQLLRANTRRTVQESKTPGSQQWHFNSFIQPVFSIEPENTVTKHLQTKEGRKLQSLNHFLVVLLKILSEYDQEIPQSQTADTPMAPRGSAIQQSRDTRNTN